MKTRRNVFNAVTDCGGVTLLMGISVCVCVCGTDDTTCVTLVFSLCFPWTCFLPHFAACLNVCVCEGVSLNEPKKTCFTKRGRKRALFGDYFQNF